MGNSDADQRPRILLVAHQAIFRRGLRCLVERDEALRVTAQAATAREALDLLRRAPCDLVLTDFDMPDEDVFLFLSRLREQGVPAVILSRREPGARAVHQAVRNGAVGFLCALASADDLLLAVHQALRGRRHLDPPAAAELAAAVEGGLDGDPTLSLREREILPLAALGLNDEAIGGRLHIAPSTVNSHRASINQKLRVRKTAAALLEALRRGWVDPLLLGLPPFAYPPNGPAPDDGPEEHGGKETKR